MKIVSKIQKSEFSTARKRLWILLLSLGLLAGSALAQDGEELRQFQYAKKLQEEGLYDLAAMQCADFIARYPGSPKLPDIRFMQGEALLQAGQYAQARAAYLALLVQHAEAPQAPLAQFRIAESLEKEGRLKEASDNYYRLYVYYPDHAQAPQALLRAAIARQRGEGFGSAEPLYRKLALNHGDGAEGAEAVLRLASGLAARGDHQAAMDLCQRLIDHPIRPLDRAQALVLQARLAELEGQWSRAQADYEGLLREAAPDSLKQVGYLGLGRLAAGLQKHDEARRALAQAAALEGPRKAQALAATARLESSLGQQDPAGAAYMALARLPRSARSDSLSLDAAAYLMGWTQLETALTLCGEVAADSAAVPAQQARALLLLARAQAQKKESAKAVATYDRFLENHSNHPLAALASLRRCQILCEDLGLVEAGLAGLRGLMAQAPLDPVMDQAHDLYATYAAQTGFVEEARRAWQWILDNAPYSLCVPQAREGLSRLGKQGLPDWVSLLEDWNQKGAEADPAERTFELGRRLLKAYGQPLAARRVLNQALEAEPQAPWAEEARVLWAGTFESEPDEAVEAYRKAARDLPEGRFQTLALAHAALLDASASMDALMEGLQHADDPALAGRLRLKTGAMLVQGGFLEAADSLLAGIGTDSEEPVSAASLALRIPLLARLGQRSLSDSLLSRYFEDYPQGQAWPHMRYVLAQRSPQKDKESLFREIADLAPHTAWADSASLALGRLLNGEGRYAEAEGLFRQALAWERLRQQAMESGLMPPAPSLTPVLNQGLSQSLLGQGKTGPARRLLEQSLAQRPLADQRLWGWSVLAGLSEQEGETDRAAWYLEQLAEAAPTDSSLSALANFHFRHQRYAACRSVLEKKKSLNLGDAMVADSRILTCLFREGQIEQGVTRFNQFKQRYRKEDGFKTCEARFQLEQGKALASAKRFEPALEALQGAAKSKVDSVVPEAEAELGRTHLIMAHVDEALEILTAMPAKYPGNPVLDRVYFTLGEHYFNSKQYENSALAYRWVVDNGTDASLRPAALRLLVRAYETIGRADGAMAAVRTFLRDYPRDPDRLAMEVKIGTLYMRLAEYDRAIEVFERLRPLADTETEAEIQYWIGKSLAAMGRWEEAIFAFLKVNYLSGETKMPWKTTAVFEAGNAYVKLDRPAEARRMFELVIRRDGSEGMFGKVARQRLAELETASATEKEQL